MTEGDHIPTGHSGVITFLIIVVVLFFILMESGNIAKKLGSAISGTSSPVAPASTITLPLADVLAAAGQVTHAANAAATATETPSTSTTASVG